MTPSTTTDGVTLEARGAHADRVVPLVRQWCATVAGFLDLAPPRRLALHVHDRAGVSCVKEGRLHLYQRPTGVARPDIPQLPHELVHMVAGLSPSRFLSEGLAVFVADRLRLDEPCWPTYRLSPDLWVAETRQHRALPPLAVLMAEADALSLTRTAGDPAAAARAWLIYVTAGSFTGYLYATRQRTRFWSGYATGALWDSPEELAALERDWLRQLPMHLDATARQQLTDSLGDARGHQQAAADRAVGR